MLGHLLTGDGADAVLRVQAGAFLLHNKVPGKDVFVVLHLGELVDLADETLLGEAHHLDSAGLEVVDRRSHRELGGIDVCSIPVQAAGKVRSHLCFNFGRAGIVKKTEGFCFAFSVLAPALVKLQWLVCE